MLKTLSTKSAKPRKGELRVGSDSRAGRAQSKFDGSGMDNVEVDGGEVEVDEFEKKVQKSSKSKKTVRSTDFFTLGAKLAFTKLRQVFIKVPILYHFDPKRYISVETDVSGYAIIGVLS